MEVSEDVVYSGETELTRSVRVRVARRFFRRAVLASYRARCCVSEIHLPALLVASQIASPKAGIADLKLQISDWKTTRRLIAVAV